MKCNTNPCLNGGTCDLDSNGWIQCKCSSEFTGKFCELEMTACSKNSPCKNDGFCVSQGTNEYYCICTRNFL